MLEAIMKEVQQVHVDWGPDIYKETDTVYPREYFEHLDGLELQVNARNTAARKMYEKLGFTEKSVNLELL